jgi:hypothetical protein
MAIVTAAECAIALGIDASDTTLLLIMAGAEHAVVNFLRYDPSKTSNTEYYPINTERSANSENVAYVDSINGRANLYTEGGVSGDILVLRNKPVWNDATLEVREQFGAYAEQTASSFGSSTILTKGTDYWLDVDASDEVSLSGILYRLGGNWPTEPGSIKVTYNGGYSTTDLAGSTDRKVADIKLAVIQSVVWNYKQVVLNANQGLAGMVAGPITSEKIGPYSYKTGGGLTANPYNFTDSLPSSARNLLQPHRSYAGMF